MAKIYFVHLYNNFSGSPNVLSNVVSSLTEQNFETVLVTSLNNKGFLSYANCSFKKNISYNFKKNVVLRLLQFVKFQIISSFYIYRNITKEDILYINTIQPLIPAIVAKVMGNRVIYHLHESYNKNSLYNRFLFYIMNRVATKIVCVSQYLQSQLEDKYVCKSVVIYNSLSKEFISAINLSKKEQRRVRSVLMVASPKIYKGILEYCKLAEELTEFEFTLVCDAKIDEIKELFSNYLTCKNLIIIPSTQNLHPYYLSADIILNLTNPRLIKETFGLTILEGMSYGLPAIVPPVGGIAELVDEGLNGYHIDVNDFTKLKVVIREFLQNDEMLKKMSIYALESSEKYQLSHTIQQIITVLDEK